MDLAARCKTSLLVEVSGGWTLVATRTPAPVVAAPVRSVPTDGTTVVTVVVPADWSNKTRTRVALAYAMDW